MSTIPASVAQWQSLAEKYAVAPLLPAEILASIWTESWGNPKACNPKDPSAGLMGVELPIAKAYGHGITALDQLYDPETNVQCGTGFLADLKRKYSATHPNWIVAYNEGEGNLLKGIADDAYRMAWEAHLLAINSVLYAAAT